MGTLTPEQQKALDDANKAKGAAGGANGKTGGAADAAAQKKLDDLAKSLGSKLNPEQLARLKAGKLTAAEMKKLGITLTPEQQKALDDANKAKGAAGGANGKTGADGKSGGAADAAAQKKLDDLAKSLGKKLNPEQLAKLKAGKLTAAEMKALGITLTPEQQKALDDANKAKGAAGGANGKT